MSDETKPQLMPCPFCGGPAEYLETREVPDPEDCTFNSILAGCAKCGVWFPTDETCIDATHHHAANAWNTRNGKAPNE